MNEKLTNIFATVLNIKPDMIGEDSSPENIESWDSLKQMNIVISIEQEFNITFTTDEIAEMTTYKKINDLIINKT